METFWYWLTQVYLENGVKRREKALITFWWWFATHLR